MIRILFVCTGNICRSPTAEGVLRRKLAEAGLSEKIETLSAGTRGYHVGDPPDPRAQKHAQARGYDLSALRARQVGAEHFDEFDLILAMDREHERDLTRLAPPEAKGRVRLFLKFAPESGLQDVPDPYYGEAADFELVLDLVEAGADGIVAAIGRGEIISHR